MQPEECTQYIQWNVIFDTPKDHDNMLKNNNTHLKGLFIVVSRFGALFVSPQVNHFPFKLFALKI